MRCKTERAICGTCQYWTGAKEPIFIQKEISKLIFLTKMGYINALKVQNMNKIAKPMQNVNVILNGRNFCNQNNSNNISKELNATCL